MSRSPNLRPWMVTLLAGGALLPIAICVVLGIGAMLTAMGDAAGGTVLYRIGLALGILWILDLIVLLLFQGVSALFGSPKNDDPADES